MTISQVSMTGSASLVGKAGVATVGVVAGPAADAAAAEKAKLEKTAKAFEAVFVRQLIGSMRSATMGDDLTGSSAVEHFQEMSDARTADAMAERGGLGIAEMLMSRLAPKAASGATAPTTGANTETGK